MKSIALSSAVSIIPLSLRISSIVKELDSLIAFVTSAAVMEFSAFHFDCDSMAMDSRSYEDESTLISPRSEA